MKPILFCDFDGVINQFPYRWAKETDGSHNREIVHAGQVNYGFFDKDFDNKKFFTADEFAMLATHKGTFAISYSGEMIERLRKLIVDDLVHFVWLTTWRNEAVSLLNPMFGFPRNVNYLEWDNKMSDHNHVFKGFAIMDYFDAHPEQSERKMVWLDDVVTKYSANWEEYKGFVEPLDSERFKLPKNNLVLYTDEKYGLSRAQMEAVELFVK